MCRPVDILIQSHLKRSPRHGSAWANLVFVSRVGWTNSATRSVWSIDDLIQTPALILESRAPHDAGSEDFKARRSQRAQEPIERGGWNERTGTDARGRGNCDERTVALCGG